ncbi:MAG: fructosamine kinase family protein [Kangiellaceae bacterium]|nr:fructosamine kinase family protein [Kangiellaceae bacterium]
MTREALQWLAIELESAITQIVPVSGGSINDCFQLTTNDRLRVFLKANKTNSLFLSEATGLREINSLVTAFAVEPLAVSCHFLLLPWYETVRATETQWRQFAHNLFVMHSQKQAYFGFHSDNYCGTTRQLNSRSHNGFEFFAEQRLMYQGRLAQQSGLLKVSDLTKLEQLANRLVDLLPDEPPVLLHGDLWSGNVLHTEQRSLLIDPACYYGWAEADLAMTKMFGGFPSCFYQEYANLSGKPESDWQTRVHIYNLYHWLNHLNLFGLQYRGTVEQIIRRFC